MPLDLEATQLGGRSYLAAGCHNWESQRRLHCAVGRLEGVWIRENDQHLEYQG